MTIRTAVAALMLAAAIPHAAVAQGGSFEELTRFTNVVSHIRANYVDSVTYRQLVHSAIDGMLRLRARSAQLVPEQRRQRPDSTRSSVANWP